MNRFWRCEDPKRKLNSTRHFDFLNRAFLDDKGREENRRYGARIAHCLTTKCHKPWDIPASKLLHDSPSYDPHAIQGHCDPLMYLVWYRYYLHSDLAPARNDLQHVEMEITTGEDLLLAKVEAEIYMLCVQDGVNFRKDWRAERMKKVPEIDTNNQLRH